MLSIVFSKLLQNFTQFFFLGVIIITSVILMWSEIMLVNKVVYDAVKAPNKPQKVGLLAAAVLALLPTGTALARTLDRDTVQLSKYASAKTIGAQMPGKVEIPPEFLPPEKQPLPETFIKNAVVQIPKDEKIPPKFLPGPQKQPVPEVQMQNVGLGDMARKLQEAKTYNPILGTTWEGKVQSESLEYGNTGYAYVYKVLDKSIFPNIDTKGASDVKVALYKSSENSNYDTSSVRVDYPEKKGIFGEDVTKSKLFGKSHNVTITRSKGYSESLKRESQDCYFVDEIIKADNGTSITKREETLLDSKGKPIEGKKIISYYYFSDEITAQKYEEVKKQLLSQDNFDILFNDDYQVPNSGARVSMGP